jgi:hypothetical protein
MKPTNDTRLPLISVGRQWLLVLVFVLMANTCFLEAGEVPISSSVRVVKIANPDVAISVGTSGAYQITVNAFGWTWGGNLPSLAVDLKTGKSNDALGSYQEITFLWQDGGRPLSGTIRLYREKDLILFSDTLTTTSSTPASPFPNFTKIPIGLFSFSYRDTVFSPPQFSLKTTSSPWLFFDQKMHSMLISAASHFLVANLIGDGTMQVASGFNKTLTNLPAGFTQQTLVALGDGINHTYDIWGHALTDLQGKQRPANDADTVLKYFGYWTDNGADYYYNYDPAKGYAGTLKALVDAYRQEQIPIRYLQLDSWWYPKTLTSPEGKQGEPKNGKLPEGDWNRYGGLLEYTASPFLFPNGLGAFHQDVGVPFVTHNRWIDPASPYHLRFKISGLAAVDPKFWDEIAAYMRANGIITYEQDWLNELFHRSPELSSTVDLGDAFLDNMARATKEQGVTMQYCMALPRCFLQGSKYDNLTTIRTAGDRFEPGKFHNFLYTSRLASALGIWPWADVFKSGETDNLLLADLSAGPVGTGDALGKENKENIFRTIRADGVIIKPDAPLLPTDSSYLAEAQHRQTPLVATTYTDHDGFRTFYLVALSKSPGSSFSIDPKDLDLTGPFYVYNYFAGTAQRLENSQSLTEQVPPTGVSYSIVAPVGKSGIAFLGDKDKFLSTGKQRIASMKDQPGLLSVEILLAPSETEVTLHGYADVRPVVDVPSAQAEPLQYDPSTKHFIVVVKPAANLPLDNGADPVRHLTVLFKTTSSE